ncbi:carboxypeptidase-like regulatory domain-containing protein [Odoribacter sp. AF15-53]|uniref:carboxypeptidase-like regulatory domain-containing protein n=1 Tax=Odoribacter sp. AF15-53 TaxID=2292236 RepID=UPI000E526315|nr:carboxypeptidase-like regulatory domain-containing protein [Odoribacter sp. AF15-53]RHR78974.1 hypothetical protein DWW52_10365 [Odoribacter sp. AF15-53]
MEKLVSKKWMMTLLVVMGFGLSAVAQAKEIAGRVFDDKGNTLPNVTIMIKGTLYGTTTNSNGEYRIVVPRGTTLVYTLSGMKIHEEIVGDSNVVNVIMEEETDDQGRLLFMQRCVYGKVGMIVAIKED